MIINDPDKLLTRYQTDLLKDNAEKTYQFGLKEGDIRFKSLNDILCTLGVEVVIKDKVERQSPTSFIEEAKEYWKGNEEILERIRDEEAAESIDIPLGEYFSETKKIVLYVGRMREVRNGHETNLFLISTFAHEVMHAYFDRPECHAYPYAMFVEEPMAEFGMLLYLRATGFDYLDWAIEQVEKKRKAKSCYGFGSDLYKQYLDEHHGLLYHLETYKTDINKYEMLGISWKHPKNYKLISFPAPMDKNRIVCGENNLFGLTDKFGKMILPTQFDSITTNDSGYRAVMDGIETSWNADGKMIL